MRIAILALTAVLCSAALVAPTSAAAEAYTVEDAFSVEFPDGGRVEYDERASGPDALVYSWRPGADDFPVALIQIRVDDLGEEVIHDLFAAYIYGMLETWESEPENYTVLAAEDGIHLGNYVWTGIDVEHKDVTPTVYHMSLSMPLSERIYSLIFYYLDPGPEVGAVMSEVLETFEALAEEEPALAAGTQ